MDKKKKQLGMSPSSASHRLVKDVLFKLVQMAEYKCHQCGKELTRDTFSIEHIEPWLDSDDPLKLYFDLDNIAFSHHSCNSGATRKRKYFSPIQREEARLEKKKESARRTYTPERRHARYKRTGN